MRERTKMRTTPRILFLLATLVLLAPSLTVLGEVQADPEPCPGIPTDPDLEEDYPTYKYRCIEPSSFVVDGRELGFSDDYDLDTIRPGINVGPCSTSYMLTDGEGKLFLTFSAHCVRESSGGDHCQVTYKKIGDPVPIEGFPIPARIAYVSGLHMQAQGATENECSDYDLAIVEIPAAYHDISHPAIRHVEGPTGLVDGFDLRYQDPMVGYGNSDDRGFVVEFITREDHSKAPLWGHANSFQGYYVGRVLEEVTCTTILFCQEQYDGSLGYHHYVRYLPLPKITGDSGSADLTASGEAMGVTSAINLATGLIATMPLYDALLKIEVETGQHYELVTWDAWSPDTIEE